MPRLTFPVQMTIDCEGEAAGHAKLDAILRTVAIASNFKQVRPNVLEYLNLEFKIGRVNPDVARPVPNLYNPKLAGAESKR